MKVFVYGILQQTHSGESFGIKSENVIGRAILSGFKRKGLCVIEPGDGEVIGELIDIDPKLEAKLYDFERGCGYKRERIEVECNDKKFKAVAYI